jgi:hypothetical protein
MYRASKKYLKKIFLGNQIMKTFISLGIFMCITIMIGNAAIGSSGSRLLKEVVSDGQTLKRVKGMPVIISKKQYEVAITPENILTELTAPINFTLLISNPTKKPVPFFIENIKIFSEKSHLEILKPEEIIERARKFYSKEEYQLDEEQEKALAPFVEDKMQMLRDSLLRTQIISPEAKTMGLMAILIPLNTEKLSIEVTISMEIHRFEFQVIELQ